MSDPRFTVHPPTVQGIPSTQPRPKKKLSHTVKAVPSAPIDGSYAPILKRGIAVIKRRRHHGR